MPTRSPQYPVAERSEFISPEQLLRSSLNDNKRPGEQVSNSDINKIIYSAMISPAEARILPWKFIIVKDPKKLELLSYNVPGSFLNKSGTIGIIVCALPDEIKLNTLGVAIIDCNTATDNIVTASDTLAIITQVTSVYPKENLMATVRTVMNIAHDVIPVTIIGLRY